MTVQSKPKQQGTNARPTLPRIYALLFVIGIFVSSVGWADDTIELLNVAVGEPTQLSGRVYQNTATLMLSRTGVLAAFYPKPRTGPKFYRISTDRGRTWSPEMNGPPELGGGADSGTLREGGVIMPVGELRYAVDGKAGWFEMPFVRFTDDMLSWKVETARLYIPGAGPRSVDGILPGMAKGKMLQLANGDVLAPMYGGIKGDSTRLHRSFLVRSKDQGRTWDYYGSIAYEPVDPAPELPGMYLSACEPTLTLMSSGRMLAMVRTQYSHLPAEYKPLAVCWSDDLGKTWTRMRPTVPYLMNISPTLTTLENGVVACQYGRPGFHVVFSLDEGHTWQNRVSFSHASEPIITGQFDMIKVGPNDVVAIGSDEEGVKAWPISVSKGKVSPASVPLAGRVVDNEGRPLVGAIVERSPNRYTADDWLEDEETKLDLWKSAPRLIGSPRLAYRSIDPVRPYPTVETGVDGRFRFDAVRLGEYVLTVEAEGHAPQHRHVKVEPRPEAQRFELKKGRLVRGQVVDQGGTPLAGVCVVLNRWHCHTDSHGYYHWALEAPVADAVNVRVYKRYVRGYETLKATFPLARIENQPIVLKSVP